MANYEDSFEERNLGENSIDQADFRMQQHLKSNGYVKNATEKQLKEHNLAGTYSKIGVDPKDGFVPRFYDVRKVLLIPDYVIYPRDSLKLFLSEVKGTNKLKEDDFNSLNEMQQKALKFNETSMSITMEVGLWWFPNPSKNKIGKYYSYSSIEKEWMSNVNFKIYEGEVDSKGNPKRYKEMNWKL